MRIPYVFLPVLFLLSINNVLDCKESRVKYNQTSLNYLDTNQNSGVSLISINEAVDFVTMLMEGEVIKAERKFKKDIPYWKVDLITLQKGIVRFEISLTSKEIIRIDSEEGPFEYEMNPAEGSISFIEAKKVAEELSGQKVLKWNYFKNKNAWEYNFWLFTKSGKAEVRVDASTGEIIRSKRKKLK